MTKMKSKEYPKKLRSLPVELSKLQEWVKRSGHRAVIVFEGRNTAVPFRPRTRSCELDGAISLPGRLGRAGKRVGDRFVLTDT